MKISTAYVLQGPRTASTYQHSQRIQQRCFRQNMSKGGSSEELDSGTIHTPIPLRNNQKQFITIPLVPPTNWVVNPYPRTERGMMSPMGTTTALRRSSRSQEPEGRERSPDII